MRHINFDGIDRKLLGLLQVEFPLTKQPYADLGLKLGIESAEVARRIRKLKRQGVIRQIGPVLDSRKLGYQSTLVAMRVPAERLERAEQLIREHPGVSHGYERDHDFNIWITLAVAQDVDVKTELERLASAIGPEVTLDLPAVRVFKLRAYFGVEGDYQPEAGIAPGADPSAKRAELSRIDRLVINELQQDLPLLPMPFSSPAAQLGMPVEDFLAQCQSFLQRGIMRRFGAAINHGKAGYKANAMVCWVAPPAMVESAGRRLASLQEVSHCYERKPNALWRHNLFAMIHSHARRHCLEVVREVCRQTGLTDHVVLFSTKEYKKTRIKYLV